MTIPCYTALLCHDWPPPPLPGNFKVDDPVQFRGQTLAVEGSGRAEDGMMGYVRGPSRFEPEKCVIVRFQDSPPTSPGTPNKDALSVNVTQLVRRDPCADSMPTAGAPAGN